MNVFSIKMPLNGEYMTTARLAVGGLCSVAGFDVDTAEDYKVCVTEALLILQRNGFSHADLTFTVGDTLACRLVGEGAGEPTQDDMDGISYALLDALLGKVDYTKDENGKVLTIAFEG